MRDTPVRWTMRDARLLETRLWDDLCEKHAYERCPYEMAAYERCTPMRGTPVRRHVREVCL
jgi:hypothetical protein